MWFWPLTEKTAPPSLDEWIAALQQLLGRAGNIKKQDPDQLSLASAANWQDLGIAEESDLGFAGVSDVAKILEEHPWLAAAERVAAQQGFFHWELDFAPVFSRGGFDLQVGNPPWVRPTEDDEALLAEGDPWWTLAHKPSEQEKVKRREATLLLPGIRELVTDGLGDTAATRSFLGDPSLFPVLAGSQPDLYRCFITRSVSHAGTGGIVALIHPETHLVEDRAAALRRDVYRRLRRFWLFKNAFRLFEMAADNTFAVNVYGEPGSKIRFLMASSIYQPDTVVRSFRHDGSGPAPSVKNIDDRWDTTPHKDRIFEVNEGTLASWSAILGVDGPATEAKVVYAVNREVASATERLAAAPRIADLGLEFSGGWHERGDREKGRFELRWSTPATWNDVILQGPHLFVSRPLYKTPNPTLKNKQDWSPVDLEALESDAVPSCGYVPSGSAAAYAAAYTHWGDSAVPARNRFRVAWRNMMQVDRERSLIPAIIPPGAAHVHGVTSAGFIEGREKDLVLIAGFASSLIADFSIRISPKSTISGATFGRVPFVDSVLAPEILLRVLRLNCVTSAYADLWEAVMPHAARAVGWVAPRSRANSLGLGDVTSSWTTGSPLRIEEDRWTAQAELDALAAVALGWTADELCTVYRSQFPILFKYERKSYFYDANGRQVPTTVLQRARKVGGGSGGEGLLRPDRTEAHPGSTVDYTYDPPFVTLDRERTMRRAHERFSSLAEERGRSE